MPPPPIDQARIHVRSPRHIPNHRSRRKRRGNNRPLLLLAPSPTPLRAAENLYFRHRTVSCIGANNSACTAGPLQPSKKRFGRRSTPEGYEGFAIDPAKIEADARFDGVFVLRTNTKLSALQVVLRYRNLLAVEDTFRAAKALLATRPIFHKTDAAIRGHVFVSFLALVLRKELFDRLSARRITGVEWHRAVDDLADLSEIEVEQDGRHALLRTAPGPTIDPLCRALRLTLPPVFQECPPAASPPATAKTCGA